MTRYLATSPHLLNGRDDEHTTADAGHVGAEQEPEVQPSQDAQALMQGQRRITRDRSNSAHD